MNRGCTLSQLSMTDTGKTSADNPPILNQRFTTCVAGKLQDKSETSSLIDYVNGNNLKLNTKI